MSDLAWVDRDGEGVGITIDLAVYPLEAVLRACHAFTGRCYVFAHPASDGQVVVDLAPRDEQTTLRNLAGEFSNALLDHALRIRIAGETRMIRELLVAQAFCEADLLDRRDIESDEHLDPRGIARRQDSSR
jgi:His-Xaa-Ser system protein HxsD